MQETQKDLQSLKKAYRQNRYVDSISMLLQWDQETKMPAHSATKRADQLEVISEIAHERKISKAYFKKLDKCIDTQSGEIKIEDISPIDKRALELYRKDYLDAKKLPSSFVKELTKLTSLSMNIWSNAKRENAFHKFSPYLEKIIVLMQKKAELLGYESHPYDALLDEYEPTMTVKDVEKLFSSLKNKIIPLLGKIKSSKQIDDSILRKSYPQDTQKKLADQLLKLLGYSKNTLRLDESNHPFCMGIYPTDVRMTTHVKVKNLPFCLLSTLHEAGHALYELNLPEKYFDTPICRYLSLGIHESQSRFWETRIGQSLPFWKFFYPYVKKTFSKKLEKTTLQQFYRAINHVSFSPIRVDSDEVTYSLHIILRFEIELALIEGSISVRDIPEIWNEKMQTYLGFKPKNNAEGCLQDIHWSFGLFGYFPTYTLGNLYSAQFFSAFHDQHLDWGKAVEKGEFSFIQDWLKDKVHQHGRRYPIAQLIKKATGKKLSIDPYISYLNDKYGELYSF